ncbi:MAG TPA: cobaltochelatase subunit CobN, partial [Methanothrix sp.]|nr:cobaltochelatase subunit CobN [Methanothrix sp.]
MRLAALCWASDVSLLLQAARETSAHLQTWTISELHEERLQECINSLNAAQAIILHPSQQDPHFGSVVEKIDKKIPIISLGLDPAMWSFSTVSSRIVSTANAYVLYGGVENVANMIRYIGKEVLGCNFSYESPRERLWQGLYHPDSKEAFSTVANYLEWRGKRHEHCVGILFFRTYWANGDLGVVDSLIRELEKDVDVLPAFCF